VWEDAILADGYRLLSTVHTSRLSTCSCLTGSCFPFLPNRSTVSFCLPSLADHSLAAIRSCMLLIVYRLAETERIEEDQTSLCTRSRPPSAHSPHEQPISIPSVSDSPPDTATQVFPSSQLTPTRLLQQALNLTKLVAREELHVYEEFFGVDDRPYRLVAYLERVREASMASLGGGGTAFVVKV
jgi:hypothetical protein